MRILGARTIAIAYDAASNRVLSANDNVTLPLQTQPDWKQQSGAKKEDLNGEEAIFA